MFPRFHAVAAWEAWASLESSYAHHSTGLERQRSGTSTRTAASLQPSCSLPLLVKAAGSPRLPSIRAYTASGPASSSGSSTPAPGAEHSSTAPAVLRPPVEGAAEGRRCTARVQQALADEQSSPAWWAGLREPAATLEQSGLAPAARSSQAEELSCAARTEQARAVEQSSPAWWASLCEWAHAVEQPDTAPAALASFTEDCHGAAHAEQAPVIGQSETAPPVLSLPVKGRRSAARAEQVASVERSGPSWWARLSRPAVTCEQSGLATAAFPLPIPSNSCIGGCRAAPLYSADRADPHKVPAAALEEFLL